MAFSDFDVTPNDPCMVNANLKSSLSSGVTFPMNGWQIEILHLPLTTGIDEILTLFTKYGAIAKVGAIHDIKARSLTYYVSFERESDSTDALKENGKKVGTSSITVIKHESSEATKGNKRLRTEDTSGGWGSSATTTSQSDGWGATDSQAADSWGGGSGGSSRGRGRGRGGSSAGGGRACFKCGEEGHMSRECPKGGGGGGGGSRACFKCGEEGHMSRECPKNVGGGGSRSCFRCGEEGHISTGCPKGGGKGCFNCGEEGHMSRECSKPRRGRGGGSGGNFGNRGNSNNSGGNEWGSSEPTASTSTVDSSWD